MTTPRTSRLGIAAALSATILSIIAPVAIAQGNNDLRQQLESTYVLTKATADSTDIVTAGSVLVLQKDNLQMDKVSMPIATHNYYKNGQLNQGGLGDLLTKLSNASLGAGSDPNNTRTFVTGEKFWMTRFVIQPDGIEFFLLSDPFQDSRYHAVLKIPFARGQTWPADQVMTTVEQVIKPVVDAGGAPANQQQAAAPAPVETKTIAIGQSKDQVAQLFGVPTKVVQLGAKEIYYYPDMKVTFIKNAVANVE